MNPDTLDDLVGPIPEWRHHAHAAIRAWCRSWIPHRTLHVYNGKPATPYLVTITWRWRGRTVHRRTLRAW